MLKKSFGILSLATLLAFPATISAEEHGSYNNPELQELDKLITHLALENEVPPEVVKSIAMIESELQQFKDGQPNISHDGGIGIMQVTDDRFDQERLADDLTYNIETGIELLQEKQNWAGGNIPRLDNAQWYHLESWYFPVLAYNGLVHANSPIRRADESLNTDAYQEKVFSIMTDMNKGLETAAITDVISLDDLDYQDDNRLSFVIDSYEIPEDDLTLSRYVLEKGQKAILKQNANLRSDASRSSENLGLQYAGNVVTLTSGYLFDETHSINPDQLTYSRTGPWFQVRMANDVSGYIAGGLIEPLHPVLRSLNATDQKPASLTDIETHWAKDEINNLANANIISGYNDGSFRPDNDISRQEFTHLIAQILDGIPDQINTDWSFEDPEPDVWANDSIMTAYQLGIITGFTDNTFQPEDHVTRAQIAVMIDRLLKLIDADLTEIEPVSFSDNHPFWADEAIQSISRYGMINGYSDGTFRAEETASRAEVAVILNRLLQ